MPCNVSVRGAFQLTPSARRATMSRNMCTYSATISIHALREEGDPANFATGSAINLISIHALRGESDGNVPCRRWRSIYFNPRPPRGGRHTLQPDGDRLSAISIHALREEGDQRPPFDACPTHYFNPRPPRGGRRQAARAWAAPSRYFNPRPPRGGRRALRQMLYRLWTISIHALRGEGDRTSPRPRHPPNDFNPQSPHGRRLPTS